MLTFVGHLPWQKPPLQRNGAEYRLGMHPITIAHRFHGRSDAELRAHNPQNEKSGHEASLF